ncbi:basic-leucine zipper transcription factor A isoform X2 [Drosophila biarmipes]|uniref:basic-leucine zipper transcription factor A isoform X2 n=1 Tax=Drosophila biarmipes TaxID=125945 RepID=UPI0021CC92DB|nr:basic-leucine zipper transcription factor A isoform X2 [Drosophila biarmipes]
MRLRVYATCHNSTTSGNWTACSRSCGLGTATRHTSTHAGCHQLSNLRLCENRKCDKDDHEDNKGGWSHPLSHKRKQHHAHSHSHQHYHHHKEHEEHEPAHRIRKGHECRSIQRLGPARVRLGECVSRKLYRPKLCGRCHRGVKCCAPAVSTTIQVELLCPLNAVDPINYVQRRERQLKDTHDDADGDDDDDDGDGDGDVAEEAVLENAQLWDTVALEPIDQEFLQSHQTQIENKFVAVEWILKCECSTKNCYTDSRNSSNSDDNMSNTNKYGYYNYKNNNRVRNHEINGEPNEPTNNNIGSNKDSGQDVDVDVVENSNNVDHNDVDNMSSEQQPDIIPYPLGVGESSWKAEKLRQQQQHEQQQQQHQQHWQQLT